jgi:Kef-type K+ transport system membrane component KefB
MEPHTFFLNLLIILLSARLFAELALYLQLPAVMGELCAGIVLGPSLLGVLEPNEVLRMLAEIGIILLLFEVGLETDVRRLIRAGKRSLLVAIGGLVAPFGLGYLAASGLFGLPLLEALFIGGTLTATSIGITVRVLADLNRHNATEGQIVIGAAVLDDIMGVVLLALLYEFSIGGGINLVNAGKVLLFVTTFFILAPVSARLISLLIRWVDLHRERPGLIPTTIISLVLFFSWLAHAIGAPEILGGFAAGLALSRRFFLPLGAALHTDHAFADRIERQMSPIIQLFTPIFFVMVGLSLDLSEVDWNSAFIWQFFLLFLVVAFAGKFAGAVLLREPWPLRVSTGLAMVPRGEVGLIFAELGRSGEIFSNDVYAGIIMVIAGTTLLPPLALKWLYARHAARFRD